MIFPGSFGRLLALGIMAAAVSSAPAQLTRVPNTSLTNLPPAPPQFGYAVNNAFPSVSLTQPVCLASPPQETNRLFILEKTGAIVVITNLASPTRTVFMSLSVLSDSESGLLGLAFHPGYATNGYFYVFSSRQFTTSQGTGRHQVISRFQVTSTNANVALPATEQILIQQFDNAGNHNGGDLHFGSDGYLYASVGDEGAQYNGSLNAQVITNMFFSAILRLDVDKRPGNLLPNPHPANSTNYFIPADNPFVGVTSFNGKTFNATNVRTEFFSIGYRNPWRFSIDPVTGFIYVGDVGQDLYEEVDVITNGANCGWAYYEGLHLAAPLYPSQNTLLTNPPPGLVFPIQEYPHSGTAGYTGNAVIGGLVYRGNRITQLYGAYVFTDNGSGNVWMLRYDGNNTIPFQLITSAASPTAIGTDPRNGDVLICQLNNGQIGRLDYNATVTGAPLPPTLAATGAFTNLTTLAPAAGIVSYDINVPFWSDNAVKSRWFSVPNPNLTIGFNPNANWSFPTGTVWIKHFELELTNGVAASRKRLETRFIVRNTNGVYGITYRWDSLTNATLVPEAGTNDTLVINDGGILRTQVWHYPSRSECLACHSVAGGYGLGFNTAQLNRDLTYGTLTTNQISALSAAGYFSAPVTNDVHSLLALAAATNTAYSLEFRTRSFLAANCSQCHQPGGAAQRASWDARITTPTSAAGLINAKPANNLGNTNKLIIVPQSPTNSILLTRISTRDLGVLPSIQMPPLASNLTNAAATQLITDWINSLPADGSAARPNFFFSLRVGTNLILRGANGWPGQYYLVRASTNLLLPPANWPLVLTNPFDPLGNFNFTNPMKPGEPKLFYLLQLP
ncbi:MAG: PQQ-dependent sugar dehydrogenase [Verrucomicrobiae bacterium]|nr:PQQ-dependent sugar dehydrogenase [Verrucomicrobiae bacterium]